jgi:hypothetical protein
MLPIKKEQKTKEDSKILKNSSKKREIIVKEK